jgi:NitT/TauT family transport system permease protein
MTVQSPAVQLRTNRRQSSGIKATQYLLTLATAMALWALVTYAGWVSDQTLATPAQVLSAFRSLSAAGEVWPQLLTTLSRILLAFVMGCILGIPLGGVLYRFRGLESALGPYLAASYSVPLVVFYPFLIVLLGINDWPVVLLTAVTTTIPIALNSAQGLRAAPRVFLHIAQAFEFPASVVFRKVLLPSAWPDVLAGMKLSMVYSVVGVVSMEFIAANSGLGNRIQYYYEAFNVPSMYVFIALTLLLAGVCVSVLLLLEELTMSGRRR